ncbi:thyroglobulin [Bufo gargarizans]|uniref:thyroglobulin n=1 Tax=Bufo gargarizans TaxID=30331 RepID=UPI001CF3684A|nr:thyroglobulin [Bufo gargarizans]
MARLIVFCFVCIISAACATIAEYQLDSQPLLPCELAREKALTAGAPYIPQCSEEGLYRNIQCDRNGATCWCVDADGAEVPGSRRTGSPVTCLSFCRLEKQQVLLSGYLNSTSTSFVPRCTESGDYDPVQCDQQPPGECWCVDSEGMEIYGTRQMGAPLQCPQRCAVRDRRILHDVGEKNPPQCGEDGGFTPVQCKLVNTTDRMVLDVVTSFSRFPNTFKSFKSLRESFPEVSGYCYCADALGRELEGTGLEMLLDEIYDTVFSGLPPSRSFPETAIYRMLQRRFLGVQLITSGRFRCPRACEVQRFTSARMGDLYIPSCEDDGGYKSMQCQEGGQCWCVDSKGREISGSRTMGETAKCDNFEDCTTRRRQSLSTLFYGTIGHFSQQSLYFTQEEESGTKISSRLCPSYLVEALMNTGLLPGQDKEDLRLRTFLGDAILGLFTSKTQVKFALQFASNPMKFQQTLFGGKFLKNLGSFNFTGAVGTNSKFSFSEFFQQIGLTGTYSGGNFKELAKLFSSEEDSYLTKDSLNSSKPEFNLNQSIQSSFGRTVNLRENRNRVEYLESLLERKEFSTFLRDVVSIPPYVAEDIFKAVKILIDSEACENRPDGTFVPRCTKDGRYEEIQCSMSECWCVNEQGREIQGTRTQDQQPRCSSKCLRERKTQIAFQRSQSAGSDVYIPVCDQKGNYLTVQCAGRHCFCVDLEGKNIPGTQKLSGENIQCPSSCQLAASNAFLQATRSWLSVPTPPLDPLQVYIPQCSPEGEWRTIQCSGPMEQAFELYQRWTNQTGTVLFLETLKVLLKYKESSSQRFSDFVQNLYDKGYQNVFPAFSKFSHFNDVPPEILEGNLTISLSDNILLNPYIFWRLISGSLSYYPGSYSDFSTPLGHLDTRSCWCVNMDGEKLEGTDAPPNKVPKCPGSCELAKMKTSQFLEDARSIIAASNSSHFPLAYSFLVASGLRLSERDLLYTLDQKSAIVLSEKFLSKDAYGLKLAAYSTLQFFWQSGANSRETTELSYIPYSPQCDGLGNWNPVQFYQGSGHYWCVDDEGSYIPGSLVTRTSGPPQCHTSCQQAKVNSLVSNWMSMKSAAIKTITSSQYIPLCTESGQYATLQKSETESWCVHPISGKVVLQDIDSFENITCPGLCTIRKSEDRVLGGQIIPSCDENGNPTREQCDLERNQCVCVFTHGEEAAGTQVTMSEKSGPSCQAPQCPFPFDAQDIQHGSVFCQEDLESGEKSQRCRVVCHKGYNNMFPSSVFTCDPKTQRWTPQPPHVQACQRLEFFQTVQTQAWFQLMLPPGKMCMGDYAGVLQSFQSFILDDLKSRGLCEIQIQSFESDGEGRLSLCDDSTVHVDCLSSNRLGVNVTWTAQLQQIPVSYLPSLHDIESALADEDLVGRLLSLVRRGDYSLNLDSKLFEADKSDFLPEDAFLRVTLQCADGFQKVLNSRTEDIRDVGGCGTCPPGSYYVDGQCTPCPAGSYQEKAGASGCQRCPLGTTSLYSGAYSRSHCVTSCRRNERGLRCDYRGQFLPSQRDTATNKYFCVDNSGGKLPWTETDVELTDDQCLLLQRFELVPVGNLMVSNEDSGTNQSSQVKEKRGRLVDCIADCSMDEDCDYLAVSTNGSGVTCQLYSGEGSDIMCTTDNPTPGALGNSASTTMDGLRCQYKIKLMTVDSVAVYRKRGQEFGDHGGFTRTDFANAFSGVYTAMLFPSSGGASFTDGYFTCRQTCAQDSCCDGFILSRVILNQGTTICALLGSPDSLLCAVKDWSKTSRLGGDGICRGVKSNPEQKKFSFFLGGQEFSGSYLLLSQSIGMADYSTELSQEMKADIQDLFFAFQRVFLRKEKTRLNISGCPQVETRSNATSFSASAIKRFLPVKTEDVAVNKDITGSNIEYWISKDYYSSDRALSWCLTRCLEEESWCRLADLRDRPLEYFSCLLYPDMWNCNNLTDRAADHCAIALSEKPQSLHHRRETLGDKVKHFYSLVPYRTLSEVSVRNRITVTGTSVSKGFFQCELHCDADPCCTGFGYVQQTGVQGEARICLLVSSLGIQSCAEADGDSWRVSNCSLPTNGIEALPFGWYQKPGDQNPISPTLCPSANILPTAEPEARLDRWIALDVSSVSLDPSLSDYDTVQIDLSSGMTLPSARSYCLSVCDRVASCVTTTVSVRQKNVKCTFYPETQTCLYNLRGAQCQLLVREPATAIYRKKASTRPVTSLTISQGGIVGQPGSIFIGSDMKYVNQFLGIPYAAPPTSENRFRPPQPYTWTGTWNATFIRPSCLQPGDGKAQYSSVSEDCLYLNLFVPQNYRTNSPVLLYFHNSPKDYAESGQTFVDGSYLAAIGDIIVVTASYRVGVFGFLSSGNTMPNGNWGLLDQSAAMKWIQENIAYFGGDPEQISIIADRAGADLASIHLLLPEATPIKRAALMGGSAFSPMLPVSERRARQQVQSLAVEVGCPFAGGEETLSCLRKVDANILNAAQTKLLAVQGPFQTWGPVVDGVYLRDTLSNLLQQITTQHIDLLIGSSEHDGLVSRSMAIKRFEEAEGRGESKMAFYQALQNSLGGEDMNPLVQGAAVWYYSLQHSSDEYAVFSRALENSTRDHFIACPVVRMAKYWSENGKGHVYMYHLPETYSQGSLDLPEDIMYAFGIPFHSNYRSQFSPEEQTLSLQIMQYLANFVRTGNPNFSYDFSRKRNMALPSWPEHRVHGGGDRYKEFTALLPNHQGLKKAECSFWNQLIPVLKSSAGLQSGTRIGKNSTESGLPSAVTEAGRKVDQGSYA